MPIPSATPDTEPLVSVDDFEVWVAEGIDSDEDFNRAKALLRSASALVLAVTGQSWTAATVPVRPADIVKQVAARAWRNPSGIVQETTGPYSTRYAETIAGGVYLEDIERRELASYGVKPSTGLRTINFTRGDDVVGGTWYVPVAYNNAAPYPLFSTDL